jgi:hypothetical protein
MAGSLNCLEVISSLKFYRAKVYEPVGGRD